MSESKYEIRAEEKSVEMSRKGALATLSRIKEYKDLPEELWAETEREGNEKFIAQTRKLWADLAVHGILGKSKEGEVNILHQTDLDGRASIGLLKLAGINTSGVEYVEPGKYVSGKINLDTGDRHGLVVEDAGKTVFFDHHTDKSGSDTSATKLVYETLLAMELLKKEEYLDKAVEFVTQIDNKTFPNEEKHFKGSMLTLLGLQRFVKFDALLRFFKDGRSPTELLSPDDLEKYGLLNAAVRQKDIVERSFAVLEEMEAKGLIIDSERYGKIAVDIGKQLPGGFDAAKAYGCGAYVIWSPDTNGFFITTVKPLQESFSQGFKVRDSMWLKPKNDAADTTIRLSEILSKLAGSSFAPKGALADYLSQSPPTAQKMEQEKMGLFEPFIAKLKMRFADDEISEDELNLKMELVKKAADSEDPSQAIKNAFADDEISEEELSELLKLQSSLTG